MGSWGGVMLEVGRVCVVWGGEWEFVLLGMFMLFCVVGLGFIERVCELDRKDGGEEVW